MTLVPLVASRGSFVDILVLCLLSQEVFKGGFLGTASSKPNSATLLVVAQNVPDTNMGHAHGYLVMVKALSLGIIESGSLTLGLTTTLTLV